MKQLIGIEYQDPADVQVTLMKDGIRINIDDRCVFVISKAKKLNVNDTRKPEKNFQPLPGATG